MKPYNISEAIKALMGYLSSKYDHRVKSCIQHKDKSIGVRLLTKPTAPMKKDSDDSSNEILDKGGEKWVVYQIKRKKYIDRITKIDDDLQ